MCFEVHHKAGSRWDVATSQYQFSKFLDVPVRSLPLNEGYDETDLVGNSCLCPIDIKKALDDAGHRFERSSHDSCSFIVEGN